MILRRKRKPIIGVTGPDNGGYINWFMTSIAVRRAGGHPVRISSSRLNRFELLQGIILSGGKDIEPSNFGEKSIYSSKYNKAVPSTKTIFNTQYCFLFNSQSKRYDLERDHFESSIIRMALAKELPILGICRGAQLLNIVLGGGLYQEIKSFYSEIEFVHSLLPCKRVEILKGSCLSNVFNSTTSIVNAHHLQAIRNTGKNIVVTAVDEAGVVQGIEYSESQYVIGVQWHPEFIPFSNQHQMLFQELIRIAR